MPFSDKLAGGPPPPPKRLCKVGRFAAGLAESEQAALSAMIASSDWTDAALQAALREEGLGVARSTLQDHRAVRCACVSTG